MKLFRFVRDSRGATALEFGLLAPAFFAAVIGTFQVGTLLWTQLGLQHATEMAARCASLNSKYSTKCNTATATKTYAATQALGMQVPSSIFTVTSGLACGNQVTASYDYTHIAAMFGVPKITLSAQSCFPPS
jgi:Flp pilus assembly protein TadG